MNKKQIAIFDKTFELFISSAEINDIVIELAQKINALKYSNVVFVSVLNGSFMFTSDLCKRIECNPEIQFIKVASYSGVHSQGKVQELIGLKKDLQGKHVFIIEDIIDSGNTIETLYETLKAHYPSSISVVTLLFKPSAYEALVPIEFVGKNIQNDFVVGYGMDYNELGRELPEIYKIVN